MVTGATGTFTYSSEIPKFASLAEFRGFDRLFALRFKLLKMAEQMKVDVELKTSPEKVWDTLRNSVTVFPTAFPELYKTIDVLEGDGKSAGSVRLLTFTEGNPFSVSKEKIETVDDEKMTVTYSVIDGDLMKFYKSYKCHIYVEPKGEGSLVKWTCDFEKVIDDPNEPVMIKEFAVKTFKDIEEYNLKA